MQTDLTQAAQGAQKEPMYPAIAHLGRRVNGMVQEAVAQHQAAAVKAADTLNPCPFCGACPEYSDVEERDDRRYVEMQLQCCVTMATTVSWPAWSETPLPQLRVQMRKTLAEQWNTRTSAPAAPVAAVPLVLTPVVYRVGPAAPDNVSIEACSSRDRVVRWAARHQGNCLNNSFEWEHEPTPSGRDDAFLARCRFDTLDDVTDAVARAMANQQEEV
jgi:hypothetical protein